MHPIRDLRHARGWTQVQLAERAGIHRVTLLRLERGYTPDPTRHGTAIDAVAIALGVERERLTP
jgi:transcriptional regulator with XRE-family HTH domain